jgi:hypothetical protein
MAASLVQFLHCQNKKIHAMMASLVIRKLTLQHKVDSSLPLGSWPTSDQSCWVLSFSPIHLSNRYPQEQTPVPSVHNSLTVYKIQMG